MSAASPGASPPTYGRLLRWPEYRSLFVGDVISLLGDQVAIVALAVLVYARTSSPLLTALTYALGYLPWIAGGPVLASVADRYPRRRVLVLCAAGEAVLTGVAALPGLPLVGLMGAAALSAFLVPPFRSAWGALMPEILDEGHYVLSLSLGQIVDQSAQLGGFLAGGTLVALFTPRGALLIDAATFVVAAVLIFFGVRARPAPSVDADEKTSLLAETRAGAVWVLHHARVRHLLVLVWVVSFYLIVPESLAAAYAAELGGGPRTVGVLMAAAAAGVVLGSALLTRLFTLERQLTIMRPLALAGALPMLVVALQPAIGVSLVCFVVAGACSASMIPARAAVMTAVPSELRGRVFGVAATGLALAQVLGMLAAGGAAQAFPTSAVIAGAGVVGLLAVGLVLGTGSHLTPGSSPDEAPV